MQPQQPPADLSARQGRTPRSAGRTARTAATVLVALFLVALPVQAMVVTYAPLLLIYAAGGGGGGEPEPGRPMWLTTPLGRTPLAPVEGGTDLTYGYDDVVLRDWRTSGTPNQQRTIEDNVARVDVDATVATSLVGEREGDIVTNSLANKLAGKLALTPGHGWFLHINRLASSEVGDVGDWRQAEMDVDGEDVRVEVAYTCKDWDGAVRSAGSGTFDLRTMASGATLGSPTALRLDWGVYGTPLDAFPGISPDPAQRNDRLEVNVLVHDLDDAYGSCAVTSRFVVDLLVAHEWYEPLVRTVCQYTLSTFSSENYHYATDFVAVFSRQSGTGATEDWAGDSRTTQVLYLPILHHQLVVHNLPDSEPQALEQAASGTTGTVRRLGVQAPPDGDVMYIVGQTGIVGGKLSGIYHQSGGPTKSQCYQVMDQFNAY